MKVYDFLIYMIFFYMIFFFIICFEFLQSAVINSLPYTLFPSLKWLSLSYCWNIYDRKLQTCQVSLSLYVPPIKQQRHKFHTCLSPKTLNHRSSGLSQSITMMSLSLIICVNFPLPPSLFCGTLNIALSKAIFFFL